MDAHTRWAALGTSSASARAYHARVAAMIAGGADLDAEARVVLELAPPPSRVLDAGCGTGSHFTSECPCPRVRCGVLPDSR